jgi:hypothetical protein
MPRSGIERVPAPDLQKERDVPRGLDSDFASALVVEFHATQLVNESTYDWDGVALKGLQKRSSDRIVVLSSMQTDSQYRRDQ